MEPIEIPPPGVQDAARASLFPQTPKAQHVLDYADAAETAGAYGEDGIGREICAIPQAKVETNGDGDAVEEDERPEEGDAEFPRA